MPSFNSIILFDIPIHNTQWSKFSIPFFMRNLRHNCVSDILRQYTRVLRTCFFLYNHPFVWTVPPIFWDKLWLITLSVFHHCTLLTYITTDFKALTQPHLIYNQYIDLCQIQSYVQEPYVTRVFNPYQCSQAIYSNTIPNTD